MSEICSNFSIKVTEKHHLPRSGIFIVEFEQISYNVLLFPFEEVKLGWNIFLLISLEHSELLVI